VGERIEEGRQLAEQRDANGLTDILAADFRGPDMITRRGARLVDAFVLPLPVTVFSRAQLTGR